MRAFPWVLLLCACRSTWGHYLVPIGADGVLPSGAGTGCASRDQAVVTLADNRFHVAAPGTVKVRCSDYDVVFEGAALASLKIAGPQQVTFQKFPYGSVELDARTADGRAFDLSLLAQGSFEWTAAAPLSVRQPTCGHMIPLCPGGLAGNGKLQRLDAKEPGKGTIGVAFLGQTATLEIDVVP